MAPGGARIMGGSLTPPGDTRARDGALPEIVPKLGAVAGPYGENPGCGAGGSEKTAELVCGQCGSRQIDFVVTDAKP